MADQIYQRTRNPKKPMTAPLTPQDLDLRDFSYMPLDVVRLRDCELAVVSSGDAFRAAVILWCASWHQVPASSLPDDDKLLASLAGFGKDVKGWRKLRADAMRGFIKCSDGRFYHPVIAEKAIEADSKRRVQKKRTKAATEARWKDRDDKRDVIRDGEHDAHRNAVQENGSEGNRTESNRIEEKGESDSRPKNFDVIEGGAIPINESYEPSDRAIEYAYSLGMKKSDLNGELSKFIAMSMATRAVSFNPDMSFKVWCDRWLEFKRKANPDWKPSPEPVVAPQEPYVIVVENTTEAACWAIYNRENRRRPLFFCQQILPSGATAIGARCPTLFPPGFDEQTGERLSSVGEVNVA